MFEAQVAFYLNKYLGQYVSGLDAESLKISVWKGDVELRNLLLKPEALAGLNLPITVKAGLLGKLTLKVPWNKLGQAPVVAEFDRLYILAAPREDDATSAPPESDDDAHVLAVEQDAKRKRVLGAENDWVKDVEEKARMNDGAGAANQGGGGGPLGLRGLIDTIVANLELRVTNIHIRFEDPSSWPGHTFSIGVMLSEISAHTVDEDGRRAFVTNEQLRTLRKGVKLSKLCVYFDCAAPRMEPPGGSWDKLDRDAWDSLLLPENHEAAGSAAGRSCRTSTRAPRCACCRTPRSGSAAACWRAP